MSNQADYMCAISDVETVLIKNDISKILELFEIKEDFFKLADLLNNHFPLLDPNGGARSLWHIIGTHYLEKIYLSNGKVDLTGRREEREEIFKKYENEGEWLCRNIVR